ncbi:MAG: peptidylprolyl isomerase [Nitrospirae bacterium]|nr:peptidylprolyl isomerase [Nitrospirota bacterium]MDE3049034.1 peptidylprolyl isomerase [Nitrospirota bacterium]MDE3219731.1 peptidylprolyl isomerase [Nitrospirota bacterium]
MNRSSNGSVNVAAVRLVSLLAGAVGGSLLLLVSCTPPPEESVLALVNGRQITQNEFETRWGELAEATRARYEKEGGKRRFLDELITRELLMQEARKQGLDQSDAIRDRAQRYREQLILDELLKDRIKAKIELSKEELDAFYEKHAHELLTPLKVQVSQMLLPNYPAAKDLEKQINQGGDFGKFAQRYSIDGKTKAKGGDLGPYHKDLVIPEVDAVIHTLKPGMVSAPIKTDAGYYLVMITALDKEIIQADLAVRERLRQELLNEKRRKRFDDVIADIRAKAIIRLADASRYVADDVGTR